LTANKLAPFSDTVHVHFKRTQILDVCGQLSIIMSDCKDTIASRLSMMYLSIFRPMCTYRIAQKLTRLYAHQILTNFKLFSLSESGESL